MRYELWSSPIINASSDKETIEITETFLKLINSEFSGNEALSIEGLPVKSSLYKLNKKSNSTAIRLQLGPSYMHQSINFPDSYELYLKQMSSRSRKSVQYSQRKIKKDFDVKLFKCEEPVQIEKFLNDAIEISKTTYQWNLLGLGLRDRDELKKTLLKWHKQDSLCSYLLYCDDIPVAFMLGYIYNDCYYYIDVGYAQQWGKHSVGSVLQLEVIEDLYSLNCTPRNFDFSTGYGEHKARFGNKEQEEVNILIMPNTLKNILVCKLYVYIDKSSSFIVNVLDNLGIKKQIKRLIRQRS